MGIEFEPSRPTCETCEYWEFSDRGTTNFFDPDFGFCRRYAPARMPEKETYVSKDNWCGEHPKMKKWIERSDGY